MDNYAHKALALPDELDNERTKVPRRMIMSSASGTVLSWSGSRLPHETD